MKQDPAIVYVDQLPDLMAWDDYRHAHQQQVVRIRLTITSDGVEILGDTPYPGVLEALLASLDPDAIEMMLCG